MSSVNKTDVKDGKVAPPSTAAKSNADKTNQESQPSKEDGLQALKATVKQKSSKTAENNEKLASL